MAKHGYCIKFCQKLGDTQIKTIHKIQQVFGNVTLSPIQEKEWFKCLKNSQEQWWASHFVKVTELQLLDKKVTSYSYFL